MKVLPERKARSLQGILAYHSYLFCTNDNTCDDPTQWDVTVLKQWRRASCLAYIASRKPYDLSREKLDELYKYYEKSTEVISKKESVNSDVAEFETSLFHQEEEHHSAVYDNTDVVNSKGEIVDN